MTTGERMKNRRKELGLSAEAVADRLGLSPATIYRYENGYIDKVPGSRLAPIADVLCTTPAYLMGWSDDSETSTDQQPSPINSTDESEISPAQPSSLSASPIDSLLRSLTDYYYSLNDEGRKKLYDYARDLSEMEKYQKDAAQKNA